MKHASKRDLKTFAIIWSLIFLAVALWPLFDAGALRMWAFFVMSFFLLVAFLAPTLLRPFYTVWMKLGEAIGNLVSKVIMLILFYGMFTPIALVLKLLGKDLLGKKLDKKSASYWVKRETQPGSLKNQF